MYPNQLQYVREYGAYLNELRETESSFVQMYNDGYAMSLDDALDYALDRLDSLEQ